MGWNLGSAIMGGAQGLLMTGTPFGAALGAVGGGFNKGTAGTVAGNAGNTVLGGLNAGAEIDQVRNYAEQVRHNSAMQWQATWFNEMMDEKSEKMRQMNELRTLAMEQRKADNEITREFIKSIRE